MLLLEDGMRYEGEEQQVERLICAKRLCEYLQSLHCCMAGEQINTNVALVQEWWQRWEKGTTAATMAVLWLLKHINFMLMWAVLTLRRQLYTVLWCVGQTLVLRQHKGEPIHRRIRSDCSCFGCIGMPDGVCLAQKKKAGKILLTIRLIFWVSCCLQLFSLFVLVQPQKEGG